MNQPAVQPQNSARLVIELEQVLKQMTEEHRKLLKHVEAQQEAMAALNMNAIDEATNLQEASRLRVAALEHKRRTLVLQLGRNLRLGGEPKIPVLAEHFPQRKPSLLALRDQLRAVMQEVATRSRIASRLAAAVLGHLNTAVRIFAGVVEQAGIYTKQGVPRVGTRISRMETIG